MKRIRFTSILIAGIALVIFGIIYGTLFAFPDPDLPPENAALYRVHELIATWSLTGGAVLMEASVAGRIIKTLDKRLVSSSSKALIGMGLFAIGGLYGAYLVLPIPNPPPQGLQWAAHGLVSITMLLSGLGLVLLAIVRTVVLNTSSHRPGR